MSAALEIDNLTIRYGQQTVLDQVSLAAKAGERIAILGPSGSGKTSLMRALNGFTPVASGSVRIHGREVVRAGRRQLRQIRSQIGFVSQRHDLIDALAVHQNVMAGALGRWSLVRALRFLLWPLPHELDEARTALARVGLADKLRSSTATLSGGEHQRVAIARALVQKPVLLLADEPVASLDPRTSEQILRLLTELAENTGLTLICSLHQPDLAERFFSRIVVVSRGRVTETSSAALALGSGL